MTERLAGVSLTTGDDYDPWHGGLGANFVNIADDVADAYDMWDADLLPIIHVMYHLDRQPGCTIQKIAAGDYDPLIEDWFMRLLEYCTEGRKAIVAYLPEMNGNWVPAYATDNYSTVDFVAAYRWFVAKGKSMGLDETKVKWMWAPNNKGWGALEDWWVDTDLVGGSAYNWGGLGYGQPWELPAELFDRYVLEVRDFTDKPIIITQTGTGLNDPRSPDWISQLAYYTDTYQNIEGFVYYNQLMFRYDPGVHDYNDRVEDCSAERPLHWFEEEPMHTSLLWLPDALRAQGVNVVELDGWKEAQGDYRWTDLDTGSRSYGGEPTCYMIHHTAGSAANPEVRNSSGKWSKANCWAGLWRDGRLYQSGGGTPTIVFTSAGPARVSSGYGHGPTLYEVADDVRVPWDQPNPDTRMAANRYAWNVETVARGDGSDIDPGVEAALITMGALLSTHYGWSPWRAIGHLTWSGRKIDPFWQGERDRIVYIQDRISEMMEGTMFTHFHVGDSNPEWEPVSWWLYMLAGGVIDANGNSSQISAVLPWKSDVRLVQDEDFDTIANLIGLSDANRAKLNTGGLYRWGKELASLRQKAYT